MPYCRNCGSKMPEDAMFCPSCGAPVEVKAPPKLDIKDAAQRYLIIGLTGAFLSAMISAFSGINLYFIPSFAASILVIYMYRINGFKESLIATFTVYLFSDGILGTLLLGEYYATNNSIILMPDLWDVFMYPLNSISALIAAYIGMKISPKRRAEAVFSPYKREEGPGGVIYHL